MDPHTKCNVLLPPIFKYCFWGPFWCRDTKSNNTIKGIISVKFVIGPMNLASLYWVEVYSSKWNWRRIKTCRQDLQLNRQTNFGKMLTNIKKTPPPLGFVSRPNSVPQAPSLYVCFMFFSTIWYYVILCLLLQFWCLILCVCVLLLTICYEVVCFLLQFWCDLNCYFCCNLVCDFFVVFCYNLVCDFVLLCE